MSARKHWQSFIALRVPDVPQGSQQHHFNKAGQERKVSKIIHRKRALRKQSYLRKTVQRQGGLNVFKKAQLNLLKVTFNCATKESLKQRTTVKHLLTTGVRSCSLSATAVFQPRPLYFPRPSSCLGVSRSTLGTTTQMWPLWVMANAIPDRGNTSWPLDYIGSSSFPSQLSS